MELRRLLVRFFNNHQIAALFKYLILLVYLSRYPPRFEFIH